MRLHGRIEKAASKDKSRPVLTQPWLNAEKGRIEATDAFIAVVVPTDVHENDVSGAVPLDAIAAARKKTDGFIECAADGARVHGYATFDRPKFETWPNIDQLVPQSKPVFSIRINPALLIRAAEALDTAHLQLDFYGAEQSIIARGRNDESYAIVMPVKGVTLAPIEVTPATVKKAA